MFWIALDDNNRVIGSVGYNSIENSDNVYLHRLFVKYDQKHCGIGTALLKTAEDHLRKIGKKQSMYIWVSLGNSGLNRTASTRKTGFMYTKKTNHII